MFKWFWTIFSLGAHDRASRGLSKLNRALRFWSLYYQGHLPKHKPQEMITQYACNKAASWPLNIRFSAAKTRFTQSKFRMLHLLHCVVLVTFAWEKKEREPLFKQTLKVTFHIITSLWVVFGLSTLISYCSFVIPLYSSVYEWLIISTLSIWMINDFNFRYMRNNPNVVIVGSENKPVI